MIINHNMASLNTYRQLSANNAQTSKSLEKLSSGLRINRAGDDAAGLAISEKMRGQIRGLDQAVRNSQDGISMIQTAEGGLSETHNILQRMRELATQAANDTNVGVDRGEIQKEINQLSSEINRIGNTTEFNTQSLLKGDGKANLDKTALSSIPGTMASGTTTHTQATQTVTMAGGQTAAALSVAGQELKFSLNGEVITISFESTASEVADTTAGYKADSATGNAATVYVRGTVGADSLGLAVTEALQQAINANDKLKGNYTVSAGGTGSEAVTVAAVSKANGGEFYGNKGYIGAVTDVAANTAAAAANIGTTAVTQATHTIDFSGINTTALATDLIGKGFTVGDKQYQFYNANEGAYTGDAIGVNISSAFATGATVANEIATAVAAQVKGDGFTAAVAASNTVVFTATAEGELGNGSVTFTDGGVQEDFKATFQVGANKGQSFTIDINDMRADALGITAKAGTAGFTTENNVTDGTSSATKEAALDVSSHTSATAAIKVINDAIETVSAERSKLGAFQNRLEHTIANLGTSSENLTAAESRVRDVDMAKEMMNFQKNNILSQAAQAMLAQANQQPQGVLQLLR